MKEIKNSKLRKLSDKIAIATTTFYNPDLESDVYRAELAKKSVRRATDLGYKIVVVDGGSADEFLREIEKYGARVFTQKSRGMGPGRREAFLEAYNIGRRVVAWTEPEKEDYISEIVKTAEPILEGNANLVVPTRKSLESYPTSQRYAEPLGNVFFSELTGHDLDMWFGPRTWGREMSDYFLNYNGEYGDKWDCIFIPVMNAIVDGKKVIGIEIEYSHPQRQTEIEEGNSGFTFKRFKQLENLMPALKTQWEKLHS